MSNLDVDSNPIYIERRGGRNLSFFFFAFQYDSRNSKEKETIEESLFQEGTELKCLDGGPADAWSIAFSTDGSKLATGANGGNVRVSFSFLK